MQENFRFSVRQIQVAKYTPVEVVQLAFLSALLERRSSGSENNEASNRFKAITHFLQEAVKVVPVESAFYAIACLENDDDAFECANAIISSKITLPFSMFVQNAVNLAAVRIGAALTAPDVYRLVFKYLSQHNILLRPFCLRDVSFSNKFSLSLGLLFPNPWFSRTFPVQPFTPMDMDITLRHLSPFAKPALANKFKKLVQTETESSHDTHYCKLSIERIYPVDSHRRHTMTISTLESPREVLMRAREALKDFLNDSQEESDANQCLLNEKMLELIRDTYNHKLKLCAALLASFMESQIEIPLLKDSSLSTANSLSTNSSPVAVGVWALFTKTFQDLQSMIVSARGNPLLVKISDYIYDVLGEGVKKSSSRSSKYAGKLQFLLQILSLANGKTVTSSMEYVSYSLEYQLCKHLKFDKEISVTRLVNDWDDIFKGDALSLIAVSHRYITARWLKWAILVHDLRSTLANYTCVGVTGLVNSGKSQLVQKLFNVQVYVCI